MTLFFIILQAKNIRKGEPNFQARTIFGNFRNAGWSEKTIGFVGLVFTTFWKLKEQSAGLNYHFEQIFKKIGQIK